MEVKASAITRKLRRVLPALLAGLFSTTAFGDDISKVDGPAPGVNVYSVQLDAAPLAALQAPGARFAKEAKMTVGLSALVSDAGLGADEYVLWLRHDGPSDWYVGTVDQPLTIQLPDRRVIPLPLHIARGGEGASQGPYVEKLEFSLVPALVDILLAEPSIVLRLDTPEGQLEKPLSPQMIDRLRQLTQRVGTHSTG